MIFQRIVKSKNILTLFSSHETSVFDEIFVKAIKGKSPDERCDYLAVGNINHKKNLFAKLVLIQYKSSFFNRLKNFHIFEYDEDIIFKGSYKKFMYIGDCDYLERKIIDLIEMEKNLSFGERLLNLFLPFNSCNRYYRNLNKIIQEEDFVEFIKQRNIINYYKYNYKHKQKENK